jgi:hypothetical protein
MIESIPIIPTENPEAPLLNGEELLAITHYSL